MYIAVLYHIMSKTQLGLFVIVAIAALMVISVQYSDAAKPVDKEVIIEENRVFDESVGPLYACGERSADTYRTGYSNLTIFSDNTVIFDEKINLDYVDENGKKYATSDSTTKFNDSFEDGKIKAHGQIKTKCMNEGENSIENFLTIVHKNGKVTEK